MNDVGQHSDDEELLGAGLVVAGAVVTGWVGGV